MVIVKFALWPKPSDPQLAAVLMIVSMVEEMPEV